MSGPVGALGMDKAARAAMLISSLRAAADQVEDAVRKETDILGVTTRKNMRESARLMRRSADAIDVAIKVQVGAAVDRKKESG